MSEPGSQTTSRPAKILAFGDSPTRMTGFGRVLRNVLNLWQTMSDDLGMAPHIHCWGIGFDGWDYETLPSPNFPWRDA